MSFFPIPPPLPSAGGGSATVTLSGGSVNSFSPGPAAAEAAVKIDDDGNVYAETNQFGTFQLNSATDWIRPASEAPGLYECRFTNHTGEAVAATADENVWHALATSDFTVILSRSSPGLVSASFTLQIRLNGGAVLASASYTLEVEFGNS